MGVLMQPLEELTADGTGGQEVGGPRTLTFLVTAGSR